MVRVLRFEKRSKTARPVKEPGVGTFLNSDLDRNLEIACAHLQGILEGYARGHGGTKIWGAWKHQLQEAYDLAQSVLDEIQDPSLRKSG